jgi:predicted metal-dependent hydrolase
MKVAEIFPYEIKRYRRAKVLRIAVKPGGRVVVTMPWRAPLYLAREFVQKKAGVGVSGQGKNARRRAHSPSGQSGRIQTA